MEKWMELGCIDFCIGTDTATIRAWAETTGRAVKEKLRRANLL
jgi:hypothetical protein